jgi:hypothetical protein
MIAFPQDNPVMGIVGRFSKSWQRFFLELRGQVGDVTLYTAATYATNGSTVNVPGPNTVLRYQQIGKQLFVSGAALGIAAPGALVISVFLPIAAKSQVPGVAFTGLGGIQCKAMQAVVGTPVGAPGREKWLSVDLSNTDGTYPTGVGAITFNVVYESYF